MVWGYPKSLFIIPEPSTLNPTYGPQSDPYRNPFLEPLNPEPEAP